MKSLILGVDPGSTSAIALIDFDGEIVKVESGKNFPPREIISEVIDEGKPVIVASDKAKFPSTVDKIATSLGTVKYELDEDLSQERKRELGEGENSHEIDAVAAARNAYRGLREKIDKIRELSEERPEEEAEIAVKYFRDNLRPEEKDDTGIEEVEEASNESVEDSKDEGSLEEILLENRRLEKKVGNLEDQVQDLKQKIEDEKEEAQRWRSKYDRMRTEKRQELMKEREISKKNAEIKEKDEKIVELEKKLESADIREKQYLKALDLLEKDGEILPVFEKTDGRPEVSVTRSKEIKKELVEQGEKVFHVDELEGVELFKRFVVEEEPGPDLKKIMEEYRDAR